jgi:glycosyltransferase involved in cell wall biosynthesis
MRKRVLYLSHAFMVGGAEEMVLSLVRRLPDRYEPMVACIHDAGPIGHEIRQTGVPFEVLGLNPGLARPLDVLRLRDFLIGADPAIVHTFLLTGSLYGRFAAMMAGVPVVIGTEVNIYENKRPAHALMEGWLMRGTDAVVASAQSVKDFYVEQVGADPSRVEVIYNAVDWSQLNAAMGRDEFRSALGIPTDALTAGIIARLTKQKAHSVLFEAMAQTPALQRMHLLVIGDGDLRDDLKTRAAALGLQHRVHFAGARRDLGNILGAVDLFVMPSLWEGLPLSLVLAMGAGLPVVATRVAGIPEVVEHDVNGLLVPAGDVAALGREMSRLVEGAELRRTLGDRARESVLPRFGFDHYVHSITALYDRTLAAKGLM